MVEKLKKYLPSPPDKSDLFLLIGTGFLFYGLHKIHPAIAYISVGLISLAVAYATAPKGVGNGAS